MITLDHQPHCRWCDKKIRKSTDYHRRRTYPSMGAVDVPLYSKADCQRLTNQIVLSLRYRDAPTKWNDETGQSEPTGEPRQVTEFSTWDGKSYEDDLFCSRLCAEFYGRHEAKLSGNLKRGAT